MKTKLRYFCTYREELDTPLSELKLLTEASKTGHFICKEFALIFKSCLIMLPSVFLRAV